MATDRTIPLAAVELRVTEAGAGGRPLLLVHGLGGSRTDFGDFIDPLAERGWHVVAPDQRGHGESSKPIDEAEYSLEIFAADLLELAGALGWDELAVLGHSMGGMIVQVLALQHPAVVRALVLMDTDHGPPAIDPDLAAFGAELLREQGVEGFLEVSKSIDDPLATPAYLKKCADDPAHEARGDRNLLASSPAMYASMIEAIVGQAPRLDRLAALAMPVLLIVGEQDEVFVEASRAMAAVIPDPRLAVLPEGGHSPQFEAPDAWWAAVSSFLDDVQALVPQPEPTDRVTA